MDELETALALCWPSYAEPQAMTRDEVLSAMVDLPSRSSSPIRTRRGAYGWFHNAHTGEIVRGWSNGTFHSRNSEYGDSVASQTMGCMYRTREEAAMAMRLEMSRDFAKKLARVDRMVRGDA